LQEHDSSVSSFTSSPAANGEQQPGSTATVSTTTTTTNTTTKHKRTKPEDVTIASMITVEHSINPTRHTPSWLTAVPVTMTTHQKGPIFLKWLQVLTNTEQLEWL
jgi:hypothetical protein